MKARKNTYIFKGKEDILWEDVKNDIYIYEEELT